MATPINIQQFQDVSSFNYSPTAADTIIVCVGWRGSAEPILNVTDTVTTLSVPVVLDQWVAVTNSTIYNMTAVFRIQNTAANMLTLAFSGGVTFGNGAYVVMQVQNVDGTTPVNFADNSPNISVGTGPFTISGTTTNDGCMIISAVSLALNNSVTVSGATVISSGIYDGQLTLGCAYEDQLAAGAFAHSYTAGVASVRAPLVAVAYNIAAGELPSITIGEFGTPTASRVFQRVGTSKVIPLSGTYANGTPTAVEARIIDVDSGLPVAGLDWQTVDAAPSGGLWSGQLTVPQGGWYYAEVRWSDTPANTAAQLQQWGVGIVTLMYGQSNMERMGTISSSPPAQGSKTSYYLSNWTAVPSGNGVREYLNRLSSLTGLPCAAANASIGGLSISELIAPSAGWSDLTGKLTGMGGDAELIIIAQGEADGQDDTSKATYKAPYTDNLQADLLTATGRSASEFTIYLALLGNSNGYLNYTDEKLERIRDAQRELAQQPGFKLSHTAIDQPLADTIHMTAAGYAEAGKRFAQSIAYHNGFASFSGLGPQMQSVATVGSSVVVSVQLDGGTALTTTGTGDFSVFEVSDDGFATLKTITGYSISGPAEITLTVAETITPPVAVRYCWGMDLMMDNVVVDNSALSVPLLPATVTELADNDRTTTVNYDIGQVSFSVDAQSASPGFQSVIDFDIGGISFSISAQQSAPGYSASVSYDIGPINYAVDAADSQPVIDDISASLSYDIGSITFSAVVFTGETALVSDPAAGIQFYEPPSGIIFY